MSAWHPMTREQAFAHAFVRCLLGRLDWAQHVRHMGANLAFLRLCRLARMRTDPYDGSGEQKH